MALARFGGFERTPPLHNREGSDGQQRNPFFGPVQLWGTLKDVSQCLRGHSAPARSWTALTAPGSERTQGSSTLFVELDSINTSAILMLSLGL